VLCGVVALAGCSTETKHRLLVFFFEGVDPPRSSSTPAPVASSAKDADASQATPVPPIPSARVVYYHQPYMEQKCTACHQTVFSPKPRMPVTKLCFECHRTRILAGKYVHAPVESGECLACHHQHSSSEPHLLIRKGQALCTECHDKGEMAKIKGHETMGAALCQSCHNPHSSNVKHLVKAP